ncbi:uncharacterized protein LOC119988655 [Tripterygium wilfordii]|uniref:uncharacterized protein LOC119988655 n=1 Tax=Tripterygium wilfordii TaxID=458696 RepID=UPI0018F84234|nr:uncharacterized protein LOC119988655 [Tripterygium wilfordii]
MKSAPRRTQAPNVPLTTVSQETQSIVVNTGGDGLDDDSDEVLDAFMESLEQNDVGIDGVDVIDGVGEELDAEGSDKGEGEGNGSSDDDPDFKVVYESDNEDILLYESDSEDILLANICLFWTMKKYVKAVNYVYFGTLI